MREVSVKELIEMFVAISYFQEARVFKSVEIWDYLNRCYKAGSEEYREKISFNDLEDEFYKVIGDMIKDKTLDSIPTKTGFCILLKVNESDSFLEISEKDHDYLECMRRVFWDIKGGETEYLTLTLSDTDEKSGHK